MCVQAEPRPRGEECSGLRSASRASTPFPSHARAQAEFIKEEMQLTVLKWQGKPIDVQVPKSMTLKVVEAAPGAAGNTAQGRTEKPAVLETGAEIMVPMFIKEGEEIKVDTDDRKYLGRAT